jgi:transposase
MSKKRITAIKTNIYTFLKEGLCKRDAAIMAGISEATFYRWLKEDESFESQIEAKILEFKRSLIKNLTICAKKDGRLALEILKRRFPDEWSDKYIQPKEDKGDDTRRLADYFQKILELPNDENDLPEFLS